MSTREITVLYFAAAATATRLDYERIPIPADGGLPLSSLSQILASRHPNKGLDQILATSQWSVNEEMVDDVSTVVLKGGEEVAVICPVSGG
ncbi:hypothetical protein BDY19DRAFT_887935 [Irpex rosettiformis]|uniref:Uncharacterized protein n=1 Tax=Irpex rosettiformis TaxID=378272 RepID=A0ACB8U7I4_9APHY|nr:hypothetical protein BDY19DRAFT_887935 [Irpex rosettiformis]